MDYNLLKIKSYKHWDVYLHENQCYLGRVFVQLRHDEGIEDFLDISGEVRDEFFLIGKYIKTALKVLFKPGKMNYAALSNTSPKIHVHLVPRYKESRQFGGVTFTDQRWGQNFAPYDRSFSIEESILFQIRDVLRKQLAIHFEPIQEAHFQLMHNWFNQPHVQAFYSLRSWTYEEVYKKLEVCSQKQISGFIIYDENHPIGYIQSYSVKEHPWENQELSQEIIENAAGFDLFIGEQNYLQKGWGHQIIESFIETHIWPNFRYCIVDPDVRNEPSIRLFLKCGFIEHQEIETNNALGQPVTLKLMIKKSIDK